jgi:hypothetical protein
MPRFGEVWEGLGLPLDLRTDKMAVMAAAIKVYETAEREYMDDSAPTFTKTGATAGGGGGGAHAVAGNSGGSSGRTQQVSCPIALLQRLGNARNMLGAHLLEATSTIDTSRGQTNVETANALWQQAYSVLSQGVTAFESIADQINAALVNCNLAKLM